MGEFGASADRKVSDPLQGDATPSRFRAGDEGEKPRAVVKPPTRIHLKWIEAERFDMGRADGPRTVIDGDSKAAPGPVETFVGALAACSSVDVISILNKRRTPPAAFEVNVVAQRAQAIPARITAVQMSFRIDGPDIDPAAAARAIHLSITKYCSVRDSIDPNIPVQWSLELNGAMVSGAIPGGSQPGPEPP